MNGYAVNRANVGSDNALCDKLKAKFANRGTAAVLGRDVPTSEIMKKIQTGVNPYDTAERPAIRTGERGISFAEAQARQGATAVAYQNTAQVARVRRKTPVTLAWEIEEKRKSEVKEYAMNSVSDPAYNGSYAVAYARAAEIRQKASVAVNDKRKLNALVASGRISAPAATRSAKIATAEVKTKAAPFPVEMITLLVVCALALMLVVYTIAQIYSFSREISGLKDRQDALNKTEQSLQIDLSERDDIRVIEDIAVNEIGMVKGDLIEKNHVSLSVSDKIEIVEDETPAKGGFLSTLLSSMGIRLSEYFN